MAAAALLVIGSCISGADAGAFWRFWESSSGMQESYSYSISPDSKGQVWVVLGAVSTMNVFDGYQMRQIPHPGLESKIGANRSGATWALNKQGLLRFEGGKWIRHQLAEMPEPPKSFRRTRMLVKEDGTVLLLLPERLIEYDARNRRVVTLLRAEGSGIGVFHSAIAAAGGGLWITGECGVGRFRDLAAGGPQWQAYESLRSGIREISDPVESAPGVLTATGRDQTSRSYLLAEFRERRESPWNVLYRGTNVLISGWRNTDGSLWIKEGQKLWMQNDQLKIPAPRKGVLSALYNEVVRQDRSVFWIAGSQGIARYAPPLWTTPHGSGPAEQVGAITEDRAGRIWFLYQDRVRCLDGKRWKEYLLPPDETAPDVNSGAIFAAEDGRIIFRVKRPVHLVLDPQTGHIERLKHPENREIVAGQLSADRRYYVVTSNGAKTEHVLETFDGARFTEIRKLGILDFGGDIRTVLPASDGTVWFGGGAGLGSHKDGRFQMATAQQGYTATGGFTVVEPEHGRVIVGAREGLFIRENNSWKVIQTGLDRVRQIIKSRDGTIWATSGTGVHRFKNSVWVTNDANDGLPSNVAYSIFEDSWGRIWAGTSEGLSVYNPLADTDTPRTRLSDSQNAKQVTPEGDVTFVFSGVDKWNNTVPSRLLFSYRLDDNEWSPFRPESAASFQQIAPGRHRLEVRAMDRNGNMDPGSQFHEFEVLLPWYRQGGFLAVTFCCVIAIGLLLALARSNYRQLRLAKLAAESSSRSKSEFLANMSHEIRTPMNGIIGMTELAMNTESKRDQRDYLQTVKESADSLMTILNDILDFSKIEAGKLELSPVDFSLRDSIGDCLRLLAVRAHEKRLELSLDIRPEIPDVLIGDSGRLRQIMINLIGNAIKFTEQGGVLVRIEMEDTGENSLGLHFSVADSGLGIPAAKQDKIFAPFEQADASTARRHGGTGLGLAIATKLVQLMHGRIWLESPWTDPARIEGGPGSLFHFTARFGLGAERTLVTPSEPVSIAGLPALIVDDNRVNRKIYLEMLTNWGMQVDAVDSGAAALAALEEADARGGPLPLLLLDFQMPLVDGLMVAEQIRQRPEFSQARMILLTSAGEPDGAKNWRELGISACLLKPAKQSELYQAICMAVTNGSPSSTSLAPLASESSVRKPGSRLNILVAEDNPVNQKLAIRLLERWGHTIAIAHNGKQALEAFERGGFDAVLMDVQMPEMDGLEAASEIRKREQHTGTRIPIFAMTANAMKGDRETCLAAGMDDYLSKPIRAQELEVLLDRVAGEIRKEPELKLT